MWATKRGSRRRCRHWLSFVLIWCRARRRHGQSRLTGCWRPAQALIPVPVPVPVPKSMRRLPPVAQDIVVAGHDQDYSGFLIFPNLPACRKIATGLPEDALPQRVLEHKALKALVRKGLRALQQESSGSSAFAQRALFLEDPPGIDAGEITDKGYINQSAVFSRRPAPVAKLHADTADADVIGA